MIWALTTSQLSADIFCGAFELRLTAGTVIKLLFDDPAIYQGGSLRRECVCARELCTGSSTTSFYIRFTEYG